MIGAVGHPWRTFLERTAAVFAAVVVLTASGTLGFVFLGDWPASDAVWMTIITITAVGYEEVRELTPATRVLATGLLAGGVTMMGIWFAVLTAAIVEMDLGHVFRTRRDMKDIDKLEDHVIVCGAGRTGRQIMAEMKTAGVPYVVLDIDQERAAQVRQADDDALVLVADATRDESLATAGIARARGLVACLSQDTDNVSRRRGSRRGPRPPARANRHHRRFPVGRADSGGGADPPAYGSHRDCDSARGVGGGRRVAL